jgi:hypothetical protein
MKRIMFVTLLVLVCATGAAAFDDGSPIAYDASSFYGPYVAITPHYLEPWWSEIPQVLLTYPGQTGYWDPYRIQPNLYDMSIMIQPGMPPEAIIDARMTPDTPAHDPALYDNWYTNTGRFPWGVNNQECPDIPGSPLLLFIGPTPGEQPIGWSDGQFRY